MLSAAIASCKAIKMAQGKTGKAAAPAKSEDHVMFTHNFGDIARHGVQLEFAEDGEDYILGWWLVPYKDYLWHDDEARVPANLIVFNFDGLVQDAVEEGGRTLKASFVSLFPSVSYRQQWGAFIKNAHAWGFTRDGKYGIRLTEERKEGSWDAEFWELKGNPRLLWKAAKVIKWAGPPIVQFIKYRGEKAVLLAFGSQKAFILSIANGKMIKSFTYGPEDTRDVLKARVKKFNIDCPDGIESCFLAYFSASHKSYNHSTRLLALGDGHSPRLRIMRVDREPKMIAELNSECNPFKPYGGYWRTVKVQFNGNGKYLVVEYWFMGGLTSTVLMPTIIYRTDTWQPCWMENDDKIKDVTLSPDGKTIAYFKSDILVVERFDTKEDIEVPFHK